MGTSWRNVPQPFPRRGLSLAAGGQWVTNWLITLSFPWLKSVPLGLAYGIYATIAVVSILFVIKAIPEPKGKELEDMDTGDEIFNKKPSKSHRMRTDRPPPVVRLDKKENI